MKNLILALGEKKVIMVNSTEHGISIVLSVFDCGTVGLESTITGKKFTRLAREINLEQKSTH